VSGDNRLTFSSEQRVIYKIRHSSAAFVMG